MKKNQVKVKQKSIPTSLSIGQEDTGNYYCPVDENNNVIRIKKKFIRAGESPPKGWVMCN